MGGREETIRRPPRALVRLRNYRDGKQPQEDLWRNLSVKGRMREQNDRVCELLNLEVSSYELLCWMP